MKLLICIVKSHRQVEAILTGFVEIGVRGATVVDGRGMGQIIATSIPIFAGFKSLFPVGGGATYLVLSVLEDERVGKAQRLIEEVCGSFDEPGSGFMFTVPVSGAWGLAREIK